MDGWRLHLGSLAEAAEGISAVIFDLSSLLPATCDVSDSVPKGHHSMGARDASSEKAAGYDGPQVAGRGSW